MNKNTGSLKQQEFEKLKANTVPKRNVGLNCIKAFVIGGAICTFGHALLNLYMSLGLEKERASMLLSITLVFLGALFTGLDLYDSLGQFAGAGSIIPITGFANSIVSSAIEYKKEGYVMGVGAKMFTIAGPVIVYGVITSVEVGLVYYIINYTGIFA